MMAALILHTPLSYFPYIGLITKFSQDQTFVHYQKLEHTMFPVTLNNFISECKGNYATHPIYFNGNMRFLKSLMEICDFHVYK